MALIELDRIFVGKRLQDVSLSIKSGEVLGIIGPNGAGKSTLLKVLAGIENHQGEIIYNNHNLNELTHNQRARLIALMPQQIVSDCSLSVYDVIALGRLPWNDTDPELLKRVMQLTETLALAERAFKQLSGGEKARVWLARTLAVQSKLLLADEPIASLDIHYQLQLLKMLKAYANKDRTIVLAIHDLSLAARFCDRLCLLKEGKLIICDTVDQVLTSERIDSVYQINSHIDLQNFPPIITAN